MKLFLAKPRGFCAGVRRAIATVERALEVWGPPIYVKHEIVHNRHVVEGLRAKGVIFVEDIREVPKGAKLIYSAHGVPPEVRKLAKERGLIEVDATCGLVTRIHSAIERYAANGYKIIFIGHKKHVEVIGAAGEAPDATCIVENVEDARKLTFKAEMKLFYVMQTTLGIDDSKEIVEVLKERYPGIKTLPTSSVCYATNNRQMALKKIVDKVELVFVVGDPKSSNSNRLKEVAVRSGKRAYLINDSNEIRGEWLKGMNTVGLTAGASTPEYVVQKCIEKLVELGVEDIQEVEEVEENTIFQLPKIS